MKYLKFLEISATLYAVCLCDKKGRCGLLLCVVNTHLVKLFLTGRYVPVSYINIGCVRMQAL